MSRDTRNTCSKAPNLVQVLNGIFADKVNLRVFLTVTGEDFTDLLVYAVEKYREA